MKKLFFLLTALVSLAATTGCDDDDERAVNVPAAVSNAFEERFPGATRVGWSDRNGYLVASFRNGGGIEAKAWFAADGRWRMTEEELAYAQLPAAVRTAFEAGEYAAWRVDDVDKLLREGLETVYVLEVEQGKNEYELYYSEQGVLIRAVADTDGDDDNEDMLPSELPSAVTDFLASRYPGARIVDAEYEHDRYEVEFVDGRTPREAIFSRSGEWIVTRTEVRRADVPAVVLDALRASPYASWEVDDIDHCLSPDGEWYAFELEEPGTDREQQLRIASDGTIL